MKCGICKRDIRRGVEQAKRVEYHLVDGEEKVFGHQMPDGPLSAATGPLVRVIHSIHYWQQFKQGNRGGPHAGGAITAWDDLDRSRHEEVE